MAVRPRTPAEWKTFLQAFNKDLLEQLDSGFIRRLRESGQSLESFLARHNVPPQAVKAGWLGYAPATADQITRLEERLGKKLPPSYRALLQASNGFLMVPSMIERLRPTDDVQWFRTENQQTIDILKPLDDLSNMLQISDREYAGTGVHLLNPDVVSADGEWQAVRYAHWQAPNCMFYPSLWEMLQWQYQFSVIFGERGDGALGRTEDIQMLPRKLPALIGQFDRLLRVLREDPYLDGPPWRDIVANVLTAARARVIAVAEGGYSAPVAFHHLRTLCEEFRAKSREGGPAVSVENTARAHGWSLAMGKITWFLNGRQEP